MRTSLSFHDLIEYTEWERQKWREWMRKHGAEVLKTSAGPNGDGRFTTVGDLMKHMFSAEKRYIDRLSGRPITDPTSIPNDDVEALFRFGEHSRKDLREFVEAFPPEQWDVPQELKLMNSILTVTPRKIVGHV